MRSMLNNNRSTELQLIRRFIEKVKLLNYLMSIPKSFWPFSYMAATVINGWGLFDVDCGTQ